MIDFSCEILSFQNHTQPELDDEINSENECCSLESIDAEEDEIMLDSERQVINHNLNLENRLRELQQTMVALKKQLADEKYMWKKQMEEIMQVSSTCEYHLNNTDPDEFKEHSVMLQPSEISMEIIPYSREVAACEHEETLSKYQDALVKIQAEKRASLRRQISINNYKRRLLEVENMCNVELMRVRQNVQSLQPLQMMAKEWKLSNRIRDFNMDEELTGLQTQKVFNRGQCESSKSEGTLVAEPPDTKCNEVHTMFSRFPQLGVKASSMALVPHWKNDDDDLGTTKVSI